MALLKILPITRVPCAHICAAFAHLDQGDGETHPPLDGCLSRTCELALCGLDFPIKDNEFIVQNLCEATGCRKVMGPVGCDRN